MNLKPKKMTLFDALNALDEPYRTKAINNVMTLTVTKEAMFLVSVGSISLGLEGAFSWAFSPEGFDYWEEQFEKLRNLGL